MVTIVLGLVGVMVILRPTVEVIHPAALVVLASAMAFGFSHTLTRAIVSEDSAFSVIFYMCLIQLPMALILSLNNWVMPQGAMWLWLLIIGLAAMSAHYTLSKALSWPIPWWSSPWISCACRLSCWWVGIFIMKGWTGLYCWVQPSCLLVTTLT